MSARLSTVASNAAKSSINGQSTQCGGSEYFDLHTRGCGYLSRIRWVETTTRGRKSAPFLCCAINALHGDVAAPSYTYFDLRVTGSDAQQLIASLEQYVAQKRKVFVAFSIGDIFAHSYERNTFDKETKRPIGKEHAALIKGRLLQVTHARVDDVVIYSAASNTSVQNDETVAEISEETATELPENVDATLGTARSPNRTAFEVDEDSIY